LCSFPRPVAAYQAIEVNKGAVMVAVLHQQVKAAGGRQYGPGCRVAFIQDRWFYFHQLVSAAVQDTAYYQHGCFGFSRIAG
jgi:hypothetical protein